MFSTLDRLDILQVSLVRNQCRTYLLDLDLPLQQLLQLCMLWARLGLPQAFRYSVQSLMNRPWLSDVVQTVSALFKQLVHADASHFEVAKQFLQEDKCGSMCELQARRCLSTTLGCECHIAVH